MLPPLTDAIPLLNVNEQQPTKLAIGGGEILDVSSVWATVQGEGPYSGRPSIFVRLAGCVMQCPACDTDYTSLVRQVHFSDLIDEILALRKECNCKLVVLTGGEPLRQNVGPLIQGLFRSGMAVQLETSGTIKLNNVPKRTKIVCSPKIPHCDPELGERAIAFKYVLRYGEVSADDGLPTSALGYPHPPARPPDGYQGEIYVQPMDEHDETRNAKNRYAALQSSLKFGYTLCLQIHKILGVE